MIIGFALEDFWTQLERAEVCAEFDAQIDQCLTFKFPRNGNGSISNLTQLQTTTTAVIAANLEEVRCPSPSFPTNSSNGP